MRKFVLKEKVTIVQKMLAVRLERTYSSLRCAQSYQISGNEDIMFRDNNKDPRGLRGEMKWRWDNAYELDELSRAAPRSLNSLSVLFISLNL